mmetsp:Transcript_18291/g.30301  ORF Transcript_18291/g.30301 Transcript_18291/m.30301 type:complete len:392 (+) Transcript_18291:52-1227(+)|eukprot:jgi/Bigna1/87177/estExt_fgenesh1_pg.C_170148
MDWLFSSKPAPAPPSPPSVTPARTLSSGDVQGWVKVNKNPLWVPVIAKTNQGHVFQRKRMDNGVQVWTDRGYLFMNVPEEMVNGTQVGTNHILSANTTIELDVKRPANLYVITEKPGQNAARDGGIISEMREQGWSVMLDAPTINGSAYGQKTQIVLRLPVAPGIVRLPSSKSELCVSIVAVSRGPVTGQNNDSKAGNCGVTRMTEEEQPSSSSDRTYLCERMVRETKYKYPLLQYSDIDIAASYDPQRAATPTQMYSLNFEHQQLGFALEETVLRAIAKKKLQVKLERERWQHEDEEKDQKDGADGQGKQSKRRKKNEKKNDTAVIVDKDHREEDAKMKAEAGESMAIETVQPEVPIVEISAANVLVRTPSQISEGAVKVTACMVVEDSR